MKESMKRRDFLKVMGVGSVYLVAKNIIPGGAVDNIIKVSKLAPTDGSGKRWGMVIDVGACIGCRQCTYACKEENSIPNAPLPMQWIETDKNAHRRRDNDYVAVPARLKSRLVGCGNFEDTEGIRTDSPTGDVDTQSGVVLGS